MSRNGQWEGNSVRPSAASAFCFSVSITVKISYVRNVILLCKYIENTPPISAVLLCHLVSRFHAQVGFEAEAVAKTFYTLGWQRWELHIPPRMGLGSHVPVALPPYYLILYRQLLHISLCLPLRVVV